MAKFRAEGKSQTGTEIKNAIMTGVSWMLPFVIAGAVIMGIARIGASLYGIDNIWDASHAQAASIVVQTLHKFDGFGGLALSLMLPVVAGYISFAIANKPGLAPGMIGGLLASSLGTGFLGALAAGFVAGYIVRAWAGDLYQTAEGAGLRRAYLYFAGRRDAADLHCYGLYHR